MTRPLSLRYWACLVLEEDGSYFRCSCFHFVLMHMQRPHFLAAWRSVTWTFGESICVFAVVHCNETSLTVCQLPSLRLNTLIRTANTDRNLSVIRCSKSAGAGSLKSQLTAAAASRRPPRSTLHYRDANNIARAH
jgi:hypothetical protein